MWQWVKDPKRGGKAIAVTLAFAMVLTLGLSSMAEEDDEPTYKIENYKDFAFDITALFRAYRKTVADNKDSIHKTKKFLGKKKNRKKMLAQGKINYKVMTKKEYPKKIDGETPEGQVQLFLEQAVAKVLRDAGKGKNDFVWKGDNKYVSKWDGKMLPARMAAGVAAEFGELTDGDITIKLTTSNKLLVNKSNKPDAWESKMIDKKLLNTTKGKKGKPIFKETDKEYRFMLPEYYGTGCISCHGTAEGQEGFKIHPSKIKRKIGDFAGVISVTIAK